MRSKFFFLCLLTVFLFQAGVVYPENGQAKFLRGISQEELWKKIELKRDNKISFTLVDLRLEADHGKGRLPGAVNAPLNKLRFLAEQMFVKTDDIVLYGYSGEDRASMNAVVLLVNKGFKHVSLLDGGFREWKGKIE